MGFPVELRFCEKCGEVTRQTFELTDEGSGSDVLEYCCPKCHSTVTEHLPPVCPSCGYDLTGNESGKCPECGHRFKKVRTLCTYCGITMTDNETECRGCGRSMVEEDT